MDQLSGCVFCLALVVMTTTVTSSIIKRDIEYSEGSCDSYQYCDGESFPTRVKVKDWTITCQGGVTDETIRENCCLPQQNHLVCYDIKVEGDRLNFSNDTKKPLASTKFTNLCEEMTFSLNRVPGSYNSASLLPGGGKSVYLYDGFKMVEPNEGDSHITHLACGVEDN